MMPCQSDKIASSVSTLEDKAVLDSEISVRASVRASVRCRQVSVRASLRQYRRTVFLPVLVCSVGYLSVLTVCLKLCLCNLSAPNSASTLRLGNLICHLHLSVLSSFYILSVTVFHAFLPTVYSVCRPVPIRVSASVHGGRKESHVECVVPSWLTHEWTINFVMG